MLTFDVTFSKDGIRKRRKEREGGKTERYSLKDSKCVRGEEGYTEEN